MGAAAGSERQTQPDQPQISEDEARRYAEQLRSAPVEQVISEVVVTVLSAAQVKLGRRDARLLIDLAALTVDHVRDFVSDTLSKQTDQLLVQLRLGQVSAEDDASKKGQIEPNDLAKAPTPPAHTSSSRSEPSPVQSKLWVPGQ